MGLMTASGLGKWREKAGRPLRASLLGALIMNDGNTNKQTNKPQTTNLIKIENLFGRNIFFFLKIKV